MINIQFHYFNALYLKKHCSMQWALLSARASVCAYNVTKMLFLRFGWIVTVGILDRVFNSTMSRGLTICHSRVLHPDALINKPTVKFRGEMMQGLLSKWQGRLYAQAPCNARITIYLWLYSPLLDLCRFFSFLIFYTVGRTPWTGYSKDCCFETRSSDILSCYPAEIIFFFFFLLSPLGACGICDTLFSLQFLNLRQSVGLLGRGISPSQGRYLHTE
jgi:hypothetical protein